MLIILILFFIILEKRSITPYTHVKFRIFNHNSLKKDVLIGETFIDLYDILKKNNGVINNVSFPLSLKLPSSTQNVTKSILSNRGPNYIFISIDGISIDMNQFPMANNTGNHTPNTNNNNSINNDQNSCNIDVQQPGTSSTSNVIAEITSSLPKWSLNDPYSSSQQQQQQQQQPNSSNNNRTITPIGSDSKITSPSRKSTLTNDNNPTDHQPSTSTTATNSAPQQSTQRSNMTQIEEPLPHGWEIRFDTYGR